MTNGQAIKAGLVHVVTCPRTSGSALVGFPSSKVDCEAFLTEHTARCQHPAEGHSVMDIRDFARR
jgi:hypothetical protein